MGSSSGTSPLEPVLLSHQTSTKYAQGDGCLVFLKKAKTGRKQSETTNLMKDNSTRQNYSNSSLSEVTFRVCACLIRVKKRFPFTVVKL